MAEQTYYNKLYGGLSPAEQNEYGGYKIARGLGGVENANLMATGTDFQDIYAAEQAAEATKPNMWNPMNWIFSPAESAMATDEERAAIERSSADIERRSGVLPGGRELPAKFRDPQQYYMENRPDYGLYDYGHRGPIASTGLQDEGEGYIKYDEDYRNPYSWEARFEDEHAPYKVDSWESNPMLQRALINQKQANLYSNEGITGLDVQEDITPEKLTILDEQRSGPVIESEEEEYINQGITSPNKWQKFLSKVTRQPYRPAMGGVTMGSGRTYSPAQLNKMNALGGWYSEPARVQRRTQKRIDNMLARREAGKSYSQKNLEALTGRDEGRGSYTATPTRSAAAAAAQGIDVGATGMMGPGGKHYMRGGRVGYNTGGRVGILSVF